MPAPGWVPDPSGRYHQRYFDGQRWTEHVADEYGRRGVDPIESIARTGLPPGLPSGNPAGVSPRPIVGLAGAFVAVIAIALLPWFDETRVATMSGVGAAGVGVLQSSYFESGWVVTVAAVFLAAAACVSPAGRNPWLASIPVGLCTLWAAVGTIMLKTDRSFLSFGFGFFVALVGLIAATVGPLLPAPASGSESGSSTATSR